MARRSRVRDVPVFAFDGGAATAGAVFSARRFCLLHEHVLRLMWFVTVHFGRVRARGNDPSAYTRG